MARKYSRLTVSCAVILAAMAGSALHAQTDEQWQEAQELKKRAEFIEERFRAIKEEYERTGELPSEECDDTSFYGNPLDSDCRIIFDREFVLEAIETPSPSAHVWQRIQELNRQKHDELRNTLLQHLASKPMPTEQDLDNFLVKNREIMLPIQGGTFTMGDYGWLQIDPWPISSDLRDDNPHQVRLTDFQIQESRVTLDDYDLYTRANNLPLIATGSIDLSMRYPNYNALVTWQQANDYCAWLGELSGERFDLPSEAQWEYVARSRGQNYAWGIAESDATKIDPSAFQNDLSRAAGDRKGPEPFLNRPARAYGANPLGVYDMLGPGEEWVKDWYAPYQSSSDNPPTNPTGPKSGTEKVVRPSVSGSIARTTVDRRAWGLDYSVDDEGNRSKEDRDSINLASFRCVINSAQ